MDLRDEWYKLTPTGRVTVLGWAIAAIAVTFYWSQTNSGLYKWLADLQRRLFGGHLDELTFLFTSLTLATPAFIIQALTRTGGLTGVPTIDGPAAAEALAPPPEPAEPRDRIVYPARFAAGLVMVGSGIYLVTTAGSEHAWLIWLGGIISGVTLATYSWKRWRASS
jgi:hypothetical protein